jgi:alpha-beta hydrolase superfamily lysophospholipase
MLVIQGEADILTYAKYAEEDFDATCKEFPESAAEYKLYPDLDHGVAAEASQSDYLPWIRDRFDNVTIAKGCKKGVVTPATKKFGIISQTWMANP